MANSSRSIPISTLHLAWAAGFIEGEGSFGSGRPHLSAAQVQREPLERLRTLFGGRIGQRLTKGFSSKPIWVWWLPIRRSVEVMMTLYVLMSPRRQQQIENILQKWKSQKRILRSHGSDACGRGHKLTDDNVYMNGRHKQCKACKKLAKAAFIVRMKERRNDDTPADAGDARHRL